MQNYYNKTSSKLLIIFQPSCSSSPALARVNIDCSTRCCCWSHGDHDRERQLHWSMSVLECVVAKSRLLPPGADMGDIGRDGWVALLAFMENHGFSPSLHHGASDCWVTSSGCQAAAVEQAHQTQAACPCFLHHLQHYGPDWHYGQHTLAAIRLVFEVLHFRVSLWSLLPLNMGSSMRAGNKLIIACCDLADIA